MENNHQDIRKQITSKNSRTGTPYDICLKTFFF